MPRAKELTLSHENLRDARKYREGAWQRASQHPELYGDDVRDDGPYPCRS